MVFVNGFDDQIHSASPVGTWNAAFDTTVFRTGSTSLRATATNLAGANLGTASCHPGRRRRHRHPRQCDPVQHVSSAQVGWFFLSDNGSHDARHGRAQPEHRGVDRLPGQLGRDLLGTVTLSGSAILSNTWGYWETKCVLSDTVGEVHVRYNGTAVLDLTGAGHQERRAPRR
jgi:hypothetical protein